MSFKVFKTLAKDTQKGAALAALAQAVSGGSEFNSLAMTGAFVDGDSISFIKGQWTGRAHYESNTDTLTYPGRNFIVKLLAAGALTLGDASLNNTATGVVRGVTITSHGMVAGQVFGVGTEFFRVLQVRDANTVDVYRGYAGSTVAAHAQAAAVLGVANLTNINLPYDFIVPVTALALATSGAQVVSAMNSLDGWNPKYNGSIGAGIQQQLTAEAQGFVWEYDSTNTRFVWYRPSRGANAGSTTLSWIENVTNGTLLGASLTEATEVGEQVSAVEIRSPSAAEVTAGIMDFCFPFAVKAYEVLSFTTSTGAPATMGATVSVSNPAVPSNSDPSVNVPAGRVTLKNNGTNNFASTETILVRVYGAPDTTDVVN